MIVPKMRIAVELPMHEDTQAESLIARAKILEVLVELNAGLLRRAVPSTIPWSKLRLEDNTDIDETLHDAIAVLNRGHGTIEELAALRVAALRAQGRSANLRCVSSKRGAVIFVTVEVVSDGTLDPWLEERRHDKD